MVQRIFITGASGFVGQAVARYFLAQNQQLVCPSRQPLSYQSPLMANPLIPELSPDLDWSAHLHEIDAVIHCAARVHVMHESAADPLALFRRVNVDATLALARQAAAAGVRQFIFISSVKVNGELTQPGKPFSEKDVSLAEDPYGISKCEAEIALLQLGEQTGMAVTIIRPPLIYGPGVKANF
jgi:UDP-glucose 4-epimerase